MHRIWPIVSSSFNVHTQTEHRANSSADGDIVKEQADKQRTKCTRLSSFDRLRWLSMFQSSHLCEYSAFDQTKETNILIACTSDAILFGWMRGQFLLLFVAQRQCHSVVAIDDDRFLFALMLFRQWFWSMCGHHGYIEYAFLVDLPMFVVCRCSCQCSEY